VENALQRAVARVTLMYENRMVMLSSIVTGAPFMGLLGTVWGVMDAFGSISGQSGASISTLAPGVSGALLTTVAGLIVAIPSVFGYNYLLTQTKLMVTELENFASNLADRIELEAKDAGEE
jgi:biopolymer transport protein TolQ